MLSAREGETIVVTEEAAPVAPEEPAGDLDAATEAAIADFETARIEDAGLGDSAEAPAEDFVVRTAADGSFSFEAPASLVREHHYATIFGGPAVALNEGGRRRVGRNDSSKSQPPSPASPPSRR